MSAFKRPSKVKANCNFRLKPIVLAVAYCFALNAAQANPIGAQVVNGTAAISQSGNTLNITNSPNAIINWQGFSINSGETTRFIQQSASSAVLNRVLGADPSVLLGTLTSNGRVFLVNPAGILVGQGARIDVAGLVASTLNLSNSDFLAGRLNFSLTPNAGAIQNNGTITTPEDGTVYLVAPKIENQGIITTPRGETILAAGNSVQLMDTGTPGVTVQVTGSDNSATNLGQILADSGRIGMVGATLKNSGTLSASSLVNEGGRIFLRARQDTYVDKDGSITATGSKGGCIEVLGNRVAVMDNALLDASGQNGGGSVLVGGDYQGKNPAIQNSQITYFGSNAGIKADAIANGDGGKAIVWADDTTRAFGSISARGGNNGGNGGFVETSGRSGLLVDGVRVATTAPMGKNGMWLLDPNAINIVAGGAGSLAAGGIFDPAVSTDIDPATITSGAYGLNSNSVTIQTATMGSGTITVTDPVSWGTANQLSLLAGNGIAINGAITGSGPLVLSTTAGDITQAAAIIVPSLAASASAGAVTLNNVSNSVGILAGYAAGSTGFGFTNAANLVVGAVAGVNGVTTANKSVNLTVATGSLDIVNAVNGVNAGTGDVTLGATTGPVSESTGKITGNSLNVTAYTAISLTNPNAISSLTASQTYSAGGGGIVFTNNAPLTINSVSQAANTGSPLVALNTLAGNGITIAGPVTVGSSSATLSISAGTSGVISGSGLLTANDITLQGNGSSGAIGSSGAPLHTSSIGGAGNANISIGFNATGPGAVNLSHAGDATLQNVFTTGAATPVNISATNNLTATSISTGTGNLILFANNLLTVPAVTLSGAYITLEANRMNLSAATSINAGGGTIWVLPTTPAWAIDLGSATDLAGSTLELSSTELNKLTAGTLRVGALGAAGSSLKVSAAIAPANAGVLSFESGGNITQVAGTITATNLAIKALGDVTLNTATNVVTNLAAQIGDGTHQNKNISFKNGAALNIGSSIDGVTGISISIDANGFIPGSPNGVIALTSTLGALGLTQSASALLAGKAVYAEGIKVSLTEANPTGIIAGKATGGAFDYTSSNAIQVTTVDGFAGIQTSNSSVILNASNSGLGVVAPISAGLGGVSMNTAGNSNINSTITGSTIDLQSLSGISLGPSASLTASGVATIILNAGTGGFFNGAGATALSTPRWLIYASSPASVVKNGLTSAFRQYNTVYGGAINTASGNGFIYASTPGALSVNTTLVSGAASNTYGTAPTPPPVFDYSLSGIFDNEDIAGTPTFTFTSANFTSTTPAGSYTVKYLSGLTSAAGYTFTAGNGLPYTVDPAPITIINIGASLTGTASKTYDGTNTATLVPGNFLLSGFVNSDSASVTKTTGTYASPNVGSGIQVSTTLVTSDFSPVGSTNLSNYTLPTGASGPIGSIAPASLTVTANNASKVYNGLAFSGGNGVSYAGLVNGETAAALSGILTYSGTSQGAINAGSYFITPGGLTSSNYNIAFTDGALTITPLAITLALAGNKVYDGTPTFSTGQLSISNAVSGNVVSLSAGSADTADKNVGVNKPFVSFSGLALAGASAGNYTLTGVSGTGTITPAALSINAVTDSRTYDGTTSSSMTPALAGTVYSGDTLSVLTQSFASKNVMGLNGSTLNVGSYTLNDGNGGANYSVTTNTALGTITPAALTVTANNATKTYDGLAFSGGNGVGYSGFVNNETSSVLGGILTYGGYSQGAINAGSYFITPSGLTSDNYNIAFVNGALTITPLAIILTLAGNKVYDGTSTFSTGQLGISNAVSGDVVSLSAGSADTADKNVGVNKPLVSISGLALAGASAGNYTLTGVSGTGTITPRPVTFTVDPGQGKTYGQFDPVRISFNDNAGAMQVVAGDSLFGILTRATGENAGAYPVAQGSLTSANNPNYDITFVGDVFTIKPASLEIIANHQTKTFGAPDPAQSFILNGLMQNAALGIDDVAAATSGTLMSGALTREAGEAVGGGSTNGEYAYALGSLSAGANYTIKSFTSNTLDIKPDPNVNNTAANTLNPLITITPPKDIDITGATGGGAPPPPPPPAPELTAGGTEGTFGNVVENGSDKETGGNGKDDDDSKKKGQKDNEGNGNGKDDRDKGKQDEKPKC